jgi:predicted ATPase
VTPQAFTFSRYRAFKEPIRVELAPLTLVIGRNGGGKSVVTRIPLLIAGGLQAKSRAPLDLQAGGITHGSRFEDLIFQRSSQPFSLGAEILSKDSAIRFSTSLRHISEKHVLGIESFHLYRDGILLLQLDAAAPEDISEREGTFLAKGSLLSQEIKSKVSFDGLFPTLIEGQTEASSSLVKLRAAFEATLEETAYIGPFRSEQGSLPRIPRQGVSSLGPKGEYALDLLGDNRLRSDGELTTQVEQWFETSMMGNRLNLTLAGDLPRLQVHDPLRAIDVDISETGAGFAQVLPIAVLAYARRLGLINASLIVLEQPELHLHPAVHGEVVDLLLDTVLVDEKNIRCICETHSEQLITRVRRRIAEGKIRPESVRVLSVGHVSVVGEEPEPIRVITFDEFGTPDSWPVGVFDEAFDDLVHIQTAGERRLVESAKGQSE